MSIQRAVLFAALVLALAAPGASSSFSALAQDAPPPAGPPAGAGIGGCESSAVTVSRPWFARNERVVWWASGFAQGTTVGVQVQDPAGRATSLPAVPVDNLCEASGSFLAEGQRSGNYILIISGTRASGGSVDLQSTFHVVSLVLPTPYAGPPPVPAAPGGVRTTTLSATTIRIDWVDNSDNETGFRIDSQAGQFTVGPNVQTYSASGLVTGRTYCFNVYAVNAAGETYGGTSCGVAEQLVSPGR